MDNSKINGKEEKLKKRCIIWRERSLLEQILLVFVAVLFIVIIALTIVTLHQTLENRRKGPKVCTSAPCIKQAAEILKSIDSKTQPCDDFYQFACGSYHQQHVLEDETTLRTSLDDLQDKIFLIIKNLLEETGESDEKFLKQAKNFYHACITKKIDGVRNAVIQLLRTSGLGEWPLSDPGRNPNFDTKLGVLTSHERNPFFATQVNSQNPFEIKIFPSDPMIQLKQEYYFGDNNSISSYQKTAYHKMILNSLVQMGIQPDDARRDASDLMEFETNLANITRKVRDTSKSLTTLNKMNEISSVITWEAWFRKAFMYSISNNIEEDVGDTLIVVIEPERLKHVFELIKNTDTKVVDNYMMWWFVIDLLPLLDTSFRRSYKEMLPFMEDKPNPIYRKRKYYFNEWKQCAHLVSEVFRAPITVAMVKNVLHPDTKNEVTDLANGLKEVYEEMVMSQNWLDKDTKIFLRNKMEKMAIEPIQSDIANNIVLKNFLKVLSMKEDDFVDGLIQIEKAFFLMHGARSTEETINSMQSPFINYPPLSPAVGYSIQQNMLAVAVGMLLLDLNNLDSPKSLIYGGLSTALARNMYSLYHEYLTGESMDILDKDVISRKDSFNYTDRLRCFKGQQAMHVSYTSYQKANKTILNDTIGFNVGLEAAYQAYLNYLKKNDDEDSILPEINLTGNQLFFLRFTQIMCEIRDKTNTEPAISLNEILYNSEEFSSVFGCPSGSPMNPKDKCAIWET